MFGFQSASFTFIRCPIWKHEPIHQMQTKASMMGFKVTGTNVFQTDLRNSAQSSFIHLFSENVKLSLPDFTPLFHTQMFRSSLQSVRNSEMKSQLYTEKRCNKMQHISTCGRSSVILCYRFLLWYRFMISKGKTYYKIGACGCVYLCFRT